MKKPYLLFTLLLLISATPTWAQTGHAPEPAAVERGLTVFEKNCQQCHQENGAGEQIPRAIRNPNYLVAIPLNENSHAWHHGDQQLAQIIQRGNKRMPPFKDVLSTSELSDVIAYMKSLWSPRILACQGPKHMSCM
jgi:mono/diheme cytochrome c family protein